jgi:AAA domain
MPVSTRPVAVDASVFAERDGVFRVIWTALEPVESDSGNTVFVSADWVENYVSPQADPDEWFDSSGYDWPSEERRKLVSVWPVLADELGRDPAVDANERPQHEHRPMLAKDLVVQGGITTVAGEEGEGKSYSVDEAAREMIRREPVWGCFEPGDVPVERVLVIHTEMSQEDVDEQADDLDARGLNVPDGTLFYKYMEDVNLLDTRDRENIENEIRLRRPDVIILDSASNAVPRPKEDEDVNPMFNWFSRVLRRLGVKAIIIVAHVTKQGGGQWTRRMFDDLFGSRVWKGRPVKILWLDDNELWVWKDRGGHLRRRLGPCTVRGIKAKAKLERPGLDNPYANPPTAINPLPSEAEQLQELDEKIVEFVSENPDEYPKTALAKELGGNYAHQPQGDQGAHQAGSDWARQARCEVARRGAAARAAERLALICSNVPMFYIYTNPGTKVPIRNPRPVPELSGALRASPVNSSDTG